MPRNKARHIYDCRERGDKNPEMKKRPGRPDERKEWIEEAGRSGRGIELILLNVTHALLQRGATPVPFVPGGNKRRFHPRDVAKLLSLPRSFLPPRLSVTSFSSRLSRI